VTEQERVVTDGPGGAGDTEGSEAMTLLGDGQTGRGGIDTTRVGHSRRPIVILALAALAVVAGDVWFYLEQDRRLRESAEQQLRTIGRSKVDHIAAWRAERADEASELMERPSLAGEIARWIADPRADGADKLQSLFRVVQKHHHYRDILLVDTSGRVRLSLSGGRGALCPSGAQALAAALRERRPIFIDLHEGPADPAPHLDAVAPLFSDSGRGLEPVGAIVTLTDVGRFLYPLIESWPTHSQTAEILLVRREGDDVVFLNELRHRKNTALKLRIPLSHRDVPSVMAVLGKEGVVEGTDYRGVPVLAFLAAVPDSPWFLVAKVDRAEAHASGQLPSVLILTLTL
jgi:hypothetical protein